VKPGTDVRRKLLRWRILWPWLAVLAIYAVISWFSAQPGDISATQSGTVTGLMGYQVEWFEILMRKLAHVMLFFILGAAVAFAWHRRCIGNRDHAKKNCPAALPVVVLCALLAALDEFHQYFVPERAALVSDVLLDTLGAAFGAMGAFLLVRLWRRRSKYG